MSNTKELMGIVATPVIYGRPPAIPEDSKPVVEPNRHQRRVRASMKRRGIRAR